MNTAAQQALATFDAVLAATPGLRVRTGQRQMAEEVARTLSTGTLSAAAQSTLPPTQTSHPGTQPLASTVDTSALGDAASIVAPSPSAPLRSMAVIEAGTGVGKSLAYTVPAVALALSRGTRVLISTATVALQEQLIHKDLPALAAQLSAQLGQPLRFALAKGRGRFVCKLKLQRLAQMGDFAPGAAHAHWLEDDLFDDAPPHTATAPEPAEKSANDPSGVENTQQPTGDAHLLSSASSRYPRLQAARREAAMAAAQAARVQWYATLAHELERGHWDGERDSLSTEPDAAQWSAIAAHAHTCTARHCPLYGSCTYYARRRELVAAQVIVANHDLVLSSLGARLLPAPDACLMVFDEAHHLPHTALAQFANHMELTRLRWLDTLTSRALRVGQLLEVQDIADIPAHASGLRQGLQALTQQTLERWGAQLQVSRDDTRSFSADAFGTRPAPAPVRVRLPMGYVPSEMLPALHTVLRHATGLAQALRTIARALKTELREASTEAARLSVLYAQLGALAPKLDAVLQTTQLLLTGALPAVQTGSQSPSHAPDPGQVIEHFSKRLGEDDGALSAVTPTLPVGTPPHAKWFTLQLSDGGFVDISAHASPLLPGAALRQRLWSQARCAVLTSATLSSGGSFEFFLRESGLSASPTCSPGLPAPRTLRVPSPFDYAAQGTLIARPTQADPSDAARFGSEMIALLLQDLAQVDAGALVLFTSRSQMRAASDALPAHLTNHVLVQSDYPRQVLLSRHRERVQRGQPSIIFGLQSFGEGLDLPGAQCRSLFITKLPFAPPDDPVGEARAEWLKASGGNPFMDLVVPATAIRLAQWVGRAIRTEDDVAHIYCYDRRLFSTHYGQQLLRGLPDFAGKPH